jgi:hypothetical protein
LAGDLLWHIYAIAAALLAGAAYPLAVRFGPCSVAALALTLVILGGIVTSRAQRSAPAWMRSRRLLWATPIVFVLGYATAAMVAREPAPEDVFRGRLGVALPSNVTAARACVRWVVDDPACYVRLQSDPAAIHQLIRKLGLEQQEPARRVPAIDGLGSRPAWWRPGEINDLIDAQMPTSPGTSTRPVSRIRFWQELRDRRSIDVWLNAQTGVSYWKIAYY